MKLGLLILGASVGGFLLGKLTLDFVHMLIERLAEDDRNNEDR